MRQLPGRFAKFSTEALITSRREALTLLRYYAPDTFAAEVLAAADEITAELELRWHDCAVR